MMLGPILSLVNGPIVGDALRDPNNRLAKLRPRNGRHASSSRRFTWPS